MNDSDERAPSVSPDEIWRRILENWHLYADDPPDDNETDGCDEEFRDATNQWRKDE